MEDFTFLTIEKLKDITALNKTVDPDYLEPFIQTSEEMHINPILGTALYSQLKTEIQEGSISGNNETLWINYINPASAWYSFYESSPFINTKATNKGLLQQSSDNSVNIDQDTFNSYKQSIKDKAVFYRNRLIEYLINNQAHYPNYRLEGDCDNISKSNASGIFLGF